MKVDPKLKWQVKALPGGDSLFTCYQCGECSAACSVFKEHPERFSPRRILQAIMLGDMLC